MNDAYPVLPEPINKFVVPKYRIPPDDYRVLMKILETTGVGSTKAACDVGVALIDAGLFTKAQADISADEEKFLDSVKQIVLKKLAIGFDKDPKLLENALFGGMIYARVHLRTVDDQQVLRWFDPFDREPLPISWLFQDLLPRGSCMLINAHPKVGKTWCVLAMALALASGTSFLGRFPVTKGKVLILSPEGGGESLRRRSWSIAAGMKLNINDLKGQLSMLENRAVRFDPQSLYFLRAKITDMQPDLIVIDPIVEFSTSTDENAAAETAKMLSGVRSLLDSAPNASVVVTHHNAKGQEFARGSSHYEAWHDVRISLSAGTDSQVEASFCMRDAIPPRPLVYNRISVVPHGFTGVGYTPVMFTVEDGSLKDKARTDKKRETLTRIADEMLAVVRDDETLVPSKVRNSVTGRAITKQDVFDKLVTNGEIELVDPPDGGKVKVCRLAKNRS
jgi:hypothetical protein